MDFLGDFLGTPLGYTICFIYSQVKNYGLSIIIFTVLLKIILIPLFLKQQKASARLSVFKPLIDEIVKKYANNPKKKNEELQKVYVTNKINPASGCLTSLLPLLVLFGMINVIHQPLTHVLHIRPEISQKALNVLKTNESSAPSSHHRGGKPHRMRINEINLINDVKVNPKRYSGLGTNFIKSVDSINMNFLGLNLGHVAKLTSTTIIIPILALIFSFLQAIISLKFDGLSQGVSILKKMIFIAPVMSFFVTLNSPIGASLYWITSYVLQILQSLLFKKFFNFDRIKKEALLEFEKIRKNKKDDNKTSAMSKISNKDRISLARRKLKQKFDD